MAAVVTPQLAAQTELREIRRGDLRALRSRVKRVRAAVPSLDGVHPVYQAHKRLLATAAREVRELPYSLSDFPVLATEPGIPRVCALAEQYLNQAAGLFTEESLAEWVRANRYDEVLAMGELWGLKPALQLELLEQAATADPVSIVDSLRSIGEADWKTLFESLSIVDHVLSDDPAHAYAAMDYESRDLYRTHIAELAQHARCPERHVAEVCVRLAREARHLPAAPGVERLAHVGYYLVDRGIFALRRQIGYRAPAGQRLRDMLLANPTLFYLGGIELTTFLIVFALLEGLDTLTPVFAGFFLLLLPATQAAVGFMNNLTSRLLRPRSIPKLDLEAGIPREFTTMVAVPALLVRESQVHELVSDLEVRYLANRDPNLFFALLTDAPDSERPFDERDRLAELCREQIGTLNERYGIGGRGPFLMFHRDRVFNPSENRWMGWERKRGKLLDLNQLLRGGFDSFPVKAGNTTVLSQVRYVIALDADTQLPRDAAAKLIGALAHPLNRAVVDPITKTVVAGYGILQPRIGISIHSASSSWIASIYSGQTGFDIYTRAISDAYQDLFGEGIFTGKGIYDVDALNACLGRRFPENALLSHDLIEGAFARVGLVSDIELIDDYPTHFSAYNRRKHRWLRGDWQIVRWLPSRVPDFDRNLVNNPITVINRWKIVDNLRRSLFEPATIALLISGWLYLPGRPAFWTTVSMSLLLMPAYAGLLFSWLRSPRGFTAMRAHARDTVESFGREHMIVVLHLVFLVHDAMVAIDAIVRSLVRVFITGRRLLEWETAAEAEARTIPKSAVDRYLRWSPIIAAILAAGVWLLRPEAISVAGPVLLAWVLAPSIARWLGSPPPARRKELHSADVQWLTGQARRSWEFFNDYGSASSGWLVPDHVWASGRVAERVSPTNLGLLLNARIAAVYLGVLTTEEFVEQTLATLEATLRLPRYRGHLLNWYDSRSGEALEPSFVSTVDSGNLVAALWTLKHAALHLKTDATHPGLDEIAQLADRLVNDMDFSFLYNRRRKVLSVGFDVASQRLADSTYDLLASESRIAAFVAIAKGDIPQESWFHLGRKHALVSGDPVLISWTGTMFEYLMPVLWMRHYPDTLLHQSARATVRVQQRFGAARRIPWGLSESASLGDGRQEYGYHAFGVPELAMRRQSNEELALVVSPYSSFLALQLDPPASVSNLRRMEARGWCGRYGFYDGIEFVNDIAEPVEIWMAHHQGMSLLAACNVLFDNPFQKYFHSEPHVIATERLLHERVPRAAIED
jgi:hypothetical protein